MTDPYAAWCYDEAVYLFGGQVEQQMDEAEAKTNDPKQVAAARERTLREILVMPTEETAEAPKGVFRDPASIGTK